MVDLYFVGAVICRGKAEVMVGFAYPVSPVYIIRPPLRVNDLEVPPESTVPGLVLSGKLDKAFNDAAPV